MTMQKQRALITGASSGLGEAFARQLAREGYDLVLTARSGDRLEALAADLRKNPRGEVEIVVADLSQRNDVQMLMGRLQGDRREIDLLVNNAGFGVFENFLDSPLEASTEQVAVNLEAPVVLAHALVPAMVRRGRGGVLNVASNAAFQPLAGANVYAASKAFLLFFSEALAYELKDTGVTVTAACPGPIATRFFANMDPALTAQEMDQPGPVVRQILEGYRRGKCVVYPGHFAVRAGTWGARLMPRNMILRMAAQTVKKLNRR